MKLRSSTVCILMCLAIAGCHKRSAPRFKLSTDSNSLARYARNAVQDELEAGFGTPDSFVVWSELPVDFGTYSGEVGRVLQSGEGGSVVLSADGLTPATELAFDSRMQSLAGAAVVVVPSDPDSAATEEGESVEPTVLRVGSYDSDSKTLQIVDQDGHSAAVNAEKGDSVQVVGSTLQFGRDLYHRHCVHCHGTSGDGNGPTAQYFNVKPRDYRRGVFKFTSTKDGVRASRDDLFRIIKLGAPGTYMPSFMLLPDDEVLAMVEYVRWLAMRGEAERKLILSLSLDHGKDEPAGEASLQENWSDYVEPVGEELNADWSLAEENGEVMFPVNEEGKSVARVEPTAESIARGRRLFMDKASANCFSCHGETARGNGASTEVINKIIGPEGKEVDAPEPGLFDVWGNKVKPRDLTSGIFRGGRRPIDIYRRIVVGIKGTPMPGTANKLEPEQVWDLVNYVLSIPTQD